MTYNISTIKQMKRGVIMAQIDYYRTTLLKKREELAKLNQDLAREQAKIAPLQKKLYLLKAQSIEQKAIPQ